MSHGEPSSGEPSLLQTSTPRRSTQRSDIPKNQHRSVDVARSAAYPRNPSFRAASSSPDAVKGRVPPGISELSKDYSELDASLRSEKIITAGIVEDNFSTFSVRDDAGSRSNEASWASKSSNSQGSKSIEIHGVPFNLQFDGDTLIDLLHAQDYQEVTALEKEAAHMLVAELVLAGIQTDRTRNTLRTRHQTTSRLSFSLRPDGGVFNANSASVPYGLSNMEHHHLRNELKKNRSDACFTLPIDENAVENHSQAFTPDHPSPDDISHRFTSRTESRSRSNAIVVTETPVDQNGATLVPDLTESSISPESLGLTVLNRIPATSMPTLGDLGFFQFTRFVNSTNGSTESLVKLRGTTNWAPPRPQVINTPFLEPPTRLRESTVKSKQDNRCAFCGEPTKTTHTGVRNYKFCYYTGKYGCVVCITSAVSVIPAKIIFNWDFKHYPVSNFAKEFLDKIWKTPLFSVKVINPRLFSSVSVMGRCNELRYCLHWVEAHIRDCPQARTVIRQLNDYDSRRHMYVSPDLYSIQDFLDIKSSRTDNLEHFLRTLFAKSRHHAELCESCLSRGNKCGICRDGKKPLFPWNPDNDKAHCEVCKTTYHKKCYRKNKQTCVQCDRRVSRVESGYQTKTQSGSAFESES